MTASNFKLSRRQVLAGASALPLSSIVPQRASAAEFDLKYATGQDPTHPVTIRAKQALDRIREATSGRVDIKLFPANQLGSDTDLLSQVRSTSSTSRR
jgi:TRAP-type C4-dicarboxylate transport system substrate-binding protein